MPGEEILVKIRFKLMNAKQIEQATNRLKKLPTIQKINSEVYDKLGKKGRHTGVILNTTAKLNADNWKKEERQLKTNVRAIDRYKGSAVTSYSRVKSYSAAAQGPVQNVMLAHLAQIPVARRLVPIFTKLGTSMHKTSAAQTALFHTSSRLRRAAWSITWGAMSMLGVFFGGFAVLRMFTRAAEMLIRPLTDIGKIAENIAKAYAFGMMAGIGPFAVGILNLGDIMHDLPKAFINAQAVVLGFSALLADLVIGMFTNEDVLSSLSIVFENFTKLWGPIKDMLIGFVVGLLKVMKYITADTDALLHFIKTIAVLITNVVGAGMQLLFMGLRAAGVGGYVDTLSAGIASAVGPWEKLGAVVAAFTGVLVPASMTAMLFLPLLSLLQVGVLASSAVFWILGAAAAAGSILMGLFAGSSSGAASVIGLLAIAVVAVISALVYFVYRLLKSEKGIAAVKSLASDFLVVMSSVADFLRGPGYEAFETLIIGVALLVGWLIDLKTWFESLPKPIQGAIGSLARFVATIGGALDAIGGLIRALANLSGMWDKSVGKLPSLPGLPSRVTKGLPSAPADATTVAKETTSVKPAPQTIYQSVTIGSVEKTADVDEVVDKFAKMQYGLFFLP